LQVRRQFHRAGKTGGNWLIIDRIPPAQASPTARFESVCETDEGELAVPRHVFIEAGFEISRDKVRKSNAVRIWSERIRTVDLAAPFAGPNLI
jgi:hypothetical protein